MSRAFDACRATATYSRDKVDLFVGQSGFVRIVGKAPGRFDYTAEVIVQQRVVLNGADRCLGPMLRCPMGD